VTTISTFSVSCMQFWPDSNHDHLFGTQFLKTVSLFVNPKKGISQKFLYIWHTSFLFQSQKHIVFFFFGSHAIFQNGFFFFFLNRFVFMILLLLKLLSLPHTHTHNNHKANIKPRLSPMATDQH
jgi:hypothetical protein